LLGLWLLLGPWLLLGLAVTACGGDPEASAAKADAGVGQSADADPWRGEPTGATARYDLSGKGWHDVPFPSDGRRDPSTGRLTLDGFPPARDDGIIPGKILEYLDFAEAELNGWSLQPTVYVAFDAPLDPARLPTAAATASASAQPTVFLVDVDPQSPERGQFMPLHTRVTGATAGQHLRANLLMAQPIWGKPLRPKTTYAFVVRRGLRDASGKVLGKPPVLHAVLGALAEADTGARTKALAALDPKSQGLATTLAPLSAQLRTGAPLLPVADIAAATVFTTGHPSGQLSAMAKWLRDQAPVAKATAWQKVTAANPDYVLITASYKAPNFQAGACPYDEDGSGGFVFDAKGLPVVQRWEDMRVSLAIPKLRKLDAKGKLPVALSAHGTGGDYLSFAEGGGVKISTRLTERGLGIISIDQPMHGPRCSPEIKGALLDFKTFNFINIAAGRSGFRQSALDTVYLARLVREGMLDVPEDVGPSGLAVAFDPGRMVFIGHSQGGLSGALVAAIEPALQAFVLSGAGAGLSLTIMLRKDPADISKTLTTLIGLDPGELDEFHPLISLVQALSDITDPLSYGRLVFDRPPGVRPPSVLLTEGLLDAATPAATSEALAAAVGLDILAPAVHLNDALTLQQVPVHQGPVSNNLARNGFQVTGLVSQWKGADHFVIFKIKAAADLYTKFLVTAVEGEAIADLAPSP